MCCALAPCPYTLSPHFVPTPCRKLFQLPDTEVRCHENGPAEPGGERSAFFRPRPRFLEPRYCRFCRNYRYCWWLPLHTPHHAVLLAGAGSRRGVPAAFAPSRGGDAASTIPHSPGRCPGPRQAITALYPCPHRITEVIMLLKVPNVIRMIALFGTAQ